MELKINPYTTPEQISFNYDELKEMLMEKAAHYEAIVYTDEDIKSAKADRANLNRLKKALNDERIKREKEYMTSFNVFKAQVNEIIGIIDKAAANSDKQIKAFEDRQREEKLKEIEALWSELLAAEKIPAGICFKHLFDEKWLNATVKMPAIKKAMDEKLAQIEKDLAVVRSLPSYAYEAEEMYKNTLDLANAVSEAHRMQEQANKKAAWEAEQAKRKAEAEAARAAAEIRPAEPSEPVEAEEEPVRKWVRFQAYMTIDEARELGKCMKRLGITYKAI